MVSCTVKPLRPPLGEYHIFCSPHNPGAGELLDEVAVKRGLQLHCGQNQRRGSGQVMGAALPGVFSRKPSAKQSALCVSSMDDDLLACDHFLVYLTGRTWTSGSTSAAFAVQVSARGAGARVRGGGSIDARSSHSLSPPISTQPQVRNAMDAGVHLLLVHEMPGAGGQEARHGCEFGNFFSCAEGTTPRDLLKRDVYGHIALPLKGGEWREASLALIHETILGRDVSMLDMKPPRALGAASSKKRVLKSWLGQHLLKSKKQTSVPVASSEVVMEMATSSSTVSKLGAAVGEEQMSVASTDQESIATVSTNMPSSAADDGGWQSEGKVTDDHQDRRDSRFLEPGADSSFERARTGFTKKRASSNI